jgi:hypothetical protein
LKARKSRWKKIETGKRTEEAAERTRLQSIEPLREEKSMGDKVRQLPGCRAPDQLELASTAEYRQLLSKFKQVEAYMEPPFVIEAISDAPAGSSEEEAGAEEVANRDLARRSAETSRGKKRSDEVVENQCSRSL